MIEWCAMWSVIGAIMLVVGAVGNTLTYKSKGVK